MLLLGLSTRLEQILILRLCIIVYLVKNSSRIPYIHPKWFCGGILLLFNILFNTIIRYKYSYQISQLYILSLHKLIRQHGLYQSTEYVYRNLNDYYLLISL